MLDMKSKSVYELKKGTVMNRFNKGISQKKQAAQGFDPFLWFFIRIFKAQLGAAPSAQAQIESAPIADGSASQDHVYTLRVFHQSAWKSRRIAIGKLGANVANKSTCFRVTYDDLLVLKIPPYPITELDEYIRAIQSERRIAAYALPDITCVVPSLSALLTKVPALNPQKQLTSDQIESHYLRLLTEDLKLQSFLKIGESFVFFMSLSSYAFLNNVVEKIHSRSNFSLSEISSHFDMLSDFNTLEPVSSDPNGAIFWDMKYLLDTYQDQLAGLICNYQTGSSIPLSRKTEWLISRLLQTTPDTEGLNLPEGFTEELHEMLDGLFVRNRDTIQSYLSVVQGDVERSFFKRQKHKNRGIITTILSLLCQLKNRRLAIRDLKPENIFLLADLKKSDRILTDPDKYVLGLIDLETAVSLMEEGIQTIPQPARTGTPAYATPSHLFPNELLLEMFGNLPRMFHLQDLYAAVGLIFYTATGKTLFENTGRLLPEIVMAAHRSPLKNRTSPELFGHVSWVFWHSAVLEFKDKQIENQKLFTELEIRVPEEAMRILRQEVEVTKKDLSNRIEHLIRIRNALKNGQTLDTLSRASHSAIRRRREKLEIEDSIPGLSPEIREKTLQFLSDLEYLRMLYEKIESLAGSLPSISLDDLLNLLFSIVLSFMYRERWTLRKPPTLLPVSPQESTPIL